MVANGNTVTVNRIVTSMATAQGLLIDAYTDVLINRELGLLSDRQPSDVMMISAVDRYGRYLVDVINALDKQNPALSPLLFKLANRTADKKFSDFAQIFGLPEDATVRVGKKALDNILRSLQSSKPVGSGKSRVQELNFNIGDDKSNRDELSWFDVKRITLYSFLTVVALLYFLTFLSISNCGEMPEDETSGWSALTGWMSWTVEKGSEMAVGYVAGQDAETGVKDVIAFTKHVNKRNSTTCDMGSSDPYIALSATADNIAFGMMSGTGVQMLMHLFTQGMGHVVFRLFHRGDDRERVDMKKLKKPDDAPAATNPLRLIRPSTTRNNPSRPALENGDGSLPDGNRRRTLPPSQRKALREKEEEERRRKALEDNQPPGSPTPGRRLTIMPPPPKDGSGKEESLEARMLGCAYCGRAAEFACAACDQVKYCSVGCQTEDWHSEHGYNCNS